MITRITIADQRQLSVTPKGYLDKGKSQTFKTAQEDCERLAAFYAQCGLLLSHAADDPVLTPRQLLEMYFGSVTILKRDCTKTKRTYSVPWVTITEEDR